jgi:hypothetical protein
MIVMVSFALSRYGQSREHQFAGSGYPTDAAPIGKGVQTGAALEDPVGDRASGVLILPADMRNDALRVISRLRTPANLH